MKFNDPWDEMERQQRMFDALGLVEALVFGVCIAVVAIFLEHATGIDLLTGWMVGVSPLGRALFLIFTGVGILLYGLSAFRQFKQDPEQK